MFRPIAQNAVRIAARGTRSAATLQTEGVKGNEFKALREGVKSHAHETTDLWRKISFYVCIPGIVVGALWVKQVEDEHAAHLDHMKHDNDGEMPERTVYPYMNIRNKPFPWGPQSAFFNPKVNIPAGEEA